MGDFNTLPTDLIVEICSYTPAHYPMMRKVNRWWRAALASFKVDIAYCINHAISTGRKVNLGNIGGIDLQKYIEGEWYDILLRAHYTWTFATGNTYFLRWLYLKCLHAVKPTCEPIANAETFDWIYNDVCIYVNGVYCGYVDGYVNEHVDGRINGHVNGRVNGRINVHINGHVNDGTDIIGVEKRRFLDNLFVHIISRYKSYDKKIAIMTIMMNNDYIIMQTHALGVKFDDCDFMHYAMNVTIMETLRNAGCPWPSDIMKTLILRIVSNARDIELYSKIFHYIVMTGYIITDDDMAAAMIAKCESIIGWMGYQGFHTNGGNLPQLTLSPSMLKLVRILAPDYMMTS
jgi:hypothetical protein